LCADLIGRGRGIGVRRAAVLAWGWRLRPLRVDRDVTEGEGQQRRKTDLENGIAHFDTQAHVADMVGPSSPNETINHTIRHMLTTFNRHSFVNARWQRFTIR